MAKQARQTEQLDLDGRSLTLRIRHNPRARRMILKVDHTSGEIHITAPTKKSMGEARDFAVAQERWISKKLDELPPRQAFEPQAVIPFRGEPTTLVHNPARRRGVWHNEQTRTIHVSGDTPFFSRRVHDWLRREARTVLSQSVANLTRAQNLALPTLTVRDTTSRWGSCSSSGTLSFSWRLILAPPDILTYVAAHESAHLTHLNHSPAFWAQVKALHPNYTDAEAWMKKNALELFRYG